MAANPRNVRHSSIGIGRSHNPITIAGVVCRPKLSKVFRLKKIGRKRIVIVHETTDLSNSPRFLVTDALHWDVSRIAITGRYRWPCEIFHQFTKDMCGLEVVQLRNEVTTI